MALSPAMSLLIHTLLPVTNINTHLHTYRKIVSSLITGLKITIGEQYWQMSILILTRIYKTFRIHYKAVSLSRHGLIS